MLREDQLAVYPLSIVLPLGTWTYQSLIVLERTAMLLSPQYAVPLSEPYANAGPAVNAIAINATITIPTDLRMISYLLFRIRFVCSEAWATKSVPLVLQPLLSGPVDTQFQAYPVGSPHIRRVLFDCLPQRRLPFREVSVVCLPLGSVWFPVPVFGFGGASGGAFGGGWPQVAPDRTSHLSPAPATGLFAARRVSVPGVRWHRWELLWGLRQTTEELLSLVRRVAVLWQSQSFGWLGAAVLATGLVAPIPVGSNDGSTVEEHCVFAVIEQASDGELITTQPRCFESFPEAIAQVSDGAVRLAAEANGSVLFSDPVVARAVSSFTLGIHFDGRNGSGSSISVSGSDCSGGWWNTPSSWDNRISSSFNGCYRLRHYDNPNRGGSYTDTTGAGATHNLASWMDNRTESVAYLGS